MTVVKTPNSSAIMLLMYLLTSTDLLRDIVFFQYVSLTGSEIALLNIATLSFAVDHFPAILPCILLRVFLVYRV